MLPTSHTLLTVQEAATKLRVSKPTIYRWIASGDLPSIRYGRERAAGDTRRGGAIRIPRAAVAELLRESAAA